MLHACAARFDVTGNLEKFCELNKTIVVVYTTIVRSWYESGEHVAQYVGDRNGFPLPQRLRASVYGRQAPEAATELGEHERAFPRPGSERASLPAAPCRARCTAVVHASEKSRLRLASPALGAWPFHLATNGKVAGHDVSPLQNRRGTEQEQCMPTAALRACVSASAAAPSDRVSPAPRAERKPSDPWRASEPTAARPWPWGQAVVGSSRLSSRVFLPTGRGGEGTEGPDGPKRCESDGWETDGCAAQAQQQGSALRVPAHRRAGPARGTGSAGRHGVGDAFWRPTSCRRSPPARPGPGPSSRCCGGSRETLTNKTTAGRAPTARLFTTGLLRISYRRWVAVLHTAFTTVTRRSMCVRLSGQVPGT